MPEKILELDTVLADYAWRKLERSMNFLKRFWLERGDYYAEVDWKTLNIEHNIMKFSHRPEMKTLDTQWGQITTGSRWVPLYGCSYENKTEAKQVHHFRGTRETTTWVAVELFNCYTVDKAVNVDLNLPTNFVKMRAGRDNVMNVSKMKGEVFKEIITWEVNSQIEIAPQMQARAELLAKEECQMIDFEIRTQLSVPKGKLKVHFKKKSDDKTAHVVELDDFYNAFQSRENGGLLDEDEASLVQVLMETTLDPEGNEESRTRIQLISQGTCTSVTWSEQKVDIKTEPSPNANNNRHVSGLVIERSNSLKD